MKARRRPDREEIVIEQLRAIVAGEITGAHLGEEECRAVLALIDRLERALAKARAQLKRRK